MPESPVHSSAIGSGTVPKTSSKPSRKSSGSSGSSRSGNGSSDDEYPEQRHAGKVGYGPAFNLQPNIVDRIHGLQEQVTGKIARNSEKIQRGKDRFSGEMKRKKRDEDMNDADPFANPAEKKEQEQERKRQQDEPHDRGEKERAATVAPGGTPKSESQRKSEPSSNIKSIG